MAMAALLPRQVGDLLCRPDKLHWFISYSFKDKLNLLLDLFIALLAAELLSIASRQEGLSSPRTESTTSLCGSVMEGPPERAGEVR
jgi:hypothetical protein